MSNTAAQLDLTAYLGEDRLFRGTHQTSGTDTTIVPITGWTITVTLKNAGSTVTKSGTVVSGTAGTYTWPLLAADTVTLGVGDWRMDVWRTDVGSATLMAVGTMHILTEVRV